MNDSDAPVGDIITCDRPENSLIKVCRWDGAIWIDVKAEGYELLSASGSLKLDGMFVDTDTYGGARHAHRIELWANGSLIAAVGDTEAGHGEFWLHADTDNVEPWACPVL